MTRRNSRCCTEAVIRSVLLVGLIALPAAADTPADSLLVDTTTVVDSLASTAVDTLVFVPDQAVSPAAVVTNPTNLEAHLYQHPTAALFKSMLVPGLGQLGNRRYFKTLLFAGLESWFIASSLHYASQAAEARQEYLEADDIAVRRDFYNLYDNKRKNRNKFAWFAGLTIFISMFDAYVDAHLSGSPVDPRNDDITFDLKPADQGGVTAQLTYRF